MSSSASSASSLAVRKTFLDFFAARGHEIVASASLVPQNDPTLLFTNAGMVQFKDVFTGQSSRAVRRAASSQKCVRAGGKHNDLENVGRTARHHTFFEMLGNFSFGDYFKEDAIVFAHQLLTREYGIAPARLVYTVHDSDAEARDLWRKIAGVSDDRVISLGDKDNFWAMGDTGPCGPCSEIHFHQGDDIPCAEALAGRPCLGPACDCDRWLEIWNLVFMQFEQVAKGERKPLPRPSVDTGMGLERLGAALGGFGSNYETDLLRPLVDEVARLSGKPFLPTDYQGASVSHRAIADHARTTAFLVADGVFPDKTGREYVLRRIMRRAIYHGWLLGIGKPFLAGLAGLVIEQMGGVYPELVERRGTIVEVTEQEERRFRETLERGVKILHEYMHPEDKTGREGPMANAGHDVGRMGNAVDKSVDGQMAFRLYDTFGFPLDLSQVIAARDGWSVDDKGFHRAMDEQRARGQFVNSGEQAVEAVWKTVGETVGATTFLGYDTTSGSSEITALVVGGREVSSASKGDGPVGVVVRATPFYGEQGGQVGDTGVLSSGGGRFSVGDTKRPISALTVHLGEITDGTLRRGDRVELAVDVERRDAIRRNHSATHLLHWALRHTLGEHVAQKGSLVTPERLRFDFSHFQPLSPGEKVRIEDLVNERVRRNLAAETAVLPLAEAKRAGAVAFFGEKYGDSVRVLTMGESKEFCGGTHVGRTGDIGFCKITDETGIAQGVRRLEATTGAGAAGYVRRLEAELAGVGARLGAGLFEIGARVEKQEANLRDKDREIDRLKRKLASGSGGGSEARVAAQVGGTTINIVVAYKDVADPKVIREAADVLKARPVTLSLIAGREGDKLSLVASTSADLFTLDAGKVLGVIAKELGGKGGGRKDMAQGGGQADRLPADPATLAARLKQLVEAQ